MSARNTPEADRGARSKQRAPVAKARRRYRPRLRRWYRRASAEFSSAVAMAEMHIESINAVTLAVHDMSRAVRLLRHAGFLRTLRRRARHIHEPTRRFLLSQSDRAAGRLPLVMVGAGDLSRIRRRRIPSPRPGPR